MLSGFPRRTERGAYRVIDGEAVVVLKEDVYVLNPAGSYLWERMEGKVSWQELCGELSRACGKAEEEVSPDLESFARELCARGLASLSGSSAPLEPPAPRVLQEFPGPYEAPAVKIAEKLEVLAGACDSGHTGNTDCRVLGSCATIFE